MFLVSRLMSLPLYRRYGVRKAASWIMPDRLYALLAFRKDHGRFPAFPPVTHNERIADLIGSGRLRDYALYGDKLALRDHAAARIGEKYLVPLYATADRLTRDLWERLPDAFMLKPNHGSHWARLVRNKHDEDFDGLVAMTDGWLAKDYYYFYRERHYHRIEPRLMFEQALDQGAVRADGDGIIDYKIYCFHGRPLFLHAVRGQPARHRSLYDFTWTKLDVRYRLPNDRTYPRPDRLDEMYQVAAAMSEGLDFARVDLFCVPDGVYFGEVTLTPLAGSDPFDPPEFDAFLGALWANPEVAKTATLERWYADAPRRASAG
jgi:hypothetical protein